MSAPEHVYLVYGEDYDESTLYAVASDERAAREFAEWLTLPFSPEPPQQGIHTIVQWKLLDRERGSDDCTYFIAPRWISIERHAVNVAKTPYFPNVEVL